MSKGNGPLDFEATLDAAKFNYMLDEMERRIKGTSNTAVKEADKMDKAFSKVGMMFGGYFSAAFGAKMISDLVKVRGEFQQLEIAFETMLKNKALSDQLMKDVVMFAAKTPFDLKGVASGAKQLLAYGESAQNVIPTMTRLGDIAAGLSIPFGDLVYLYGTSRTQGKLMTKDLMQFAGRGIPIIDELSKVLKVSKARVLEMASESKISFEHLETVIKNLTSETGMFGGMMAKQAGSLSGLVSNLGDAWDRMLNKIGQSNQEGFADAIKIATNLVENYQEVLNILKTVVAAYGTYRAVVMLNAAAIKGYDTALSAVIIKEKILAVVKKATPFGLALTGITALIGALYTYRQSMQDNVTLQQSINSETGKEITSLNSLFTSLKKAKEGTDKRNDAIKIANDRYGKYLDNLLTEKSTLNEIEAAQKRVTNALIADISVKQSKAKLEETLGEIGEQFDESFATYLEAFSGTYGTDRLGEFINSINAAVDKEIDTRGGKIERGVLEYSGFAKKVYDEFVSDISRRSGYMKLSFDEFKTAFLDFAETKAENLPAIEQMQAMISSFQGIVDGFKGTETKTEDTTPLLPDKKTFAEKLEETKKQFDIYYKWIEHYGKESADKTFSTLITGGDSFLEYLDSEIEKLDKKSKRTKQDDQNLGMLLGTKDELLGNKTQLEFLQEYIDNAKEGYNDLVDYIGFLKDELESFENDGSEQSYQKFILIQQALNDAENEFVKTSAETYNSLIDQAQNYNIRKEQIEKQFNDTIKKLDKETLGEKYDQAVKVAEDIRDKNLQELDVEIIQRSEAYKKLSGDLDSLNRKQIKAYIDALKKQLKLLNAQSDEYKSIASLIDGATKELDNKTGKTFDEISQGFSSLSDMVDGIDSSLSQTFELASNLSRSLSQIATGNIAGGIISGATTIFKYISETGKRHDAEYEAAKQESLEKTKGFIDNLNKSLERQLELIDEVTGVDKIAAYGAAFSQVGQNIQEVTDRLREFQVVYEQSGTSGNGRGGGNARHETGLLEISDVDLDLKGLTNVEKIQKTTEAIATLEEDIASVRKLIDAGQIKDSEELQAQLEAYEQYTDELKDLQNEFFAEVTGTTYESLLDSFINAFEQGLTSAEYFANSFEDMMRQAMLQALSINALQTPLNEWYQAFAEASADGLTETEIKTLRESLESIYSNSEDYAEMLEQASGINFGQEKEKESQDKLASAVKGVNQETAGLIAGYMNAIRLNQAQSLSIMNKKLEVLNRIELNTRYSRLMYEFMVTNQSNNTLPSTRING